MLVRRLTAALVCLLCCASLALAQGNPVRGHLTVYGGVNSCGAETGAANAYACVLTPPLATYLVGSSYSFIAVHPNTAASTINVGPGVLTLKKYVSGAKTDLVANDIGAGQPVVCEYDGTDCVVTSTLGNASGSLVPMTRTLTLQGTATQVTVTPNTAQDLSANRSWTFSLPSLVAAQFADKGAAVYNVLAYGALCDGVTDDSTAIGAAITAASAACGVVQFPAGTCILNSQIVTPACGFRITGAGAGKAAQGNPPVGGTILQMGFSGATAKIVATNSALFELDHITLQETGASTTTPFISTTSTILHIYDAEIVGHSSKSGTACNQDAIILGNTTFAGYGTVIERVHFDRIRRAAYFQNAANNIIFRDNAIENNTGSNITTAITAATNANPAVLTVTGHGFPVGASFALTLSGFTGNWTPLNATLTLTVLTANTFSVPVDSTTFGALTGTPVYLSGAALEFVGAASRPAGNVVSGNLFEMGGYPYAVILGTNATENVFQANSLYDPTSGTIIAGYRVNSDAQHNTISAGGRRATGIPFFVLDVNSPNITTFVDGSNSGAEQFVNPMTLLNVLTINRNTVAVPTISAGAPLVVSAADAGPATIVLNSYGQNADFIFTRARGTNAAPLAINANNFIGTIGGRAYDGTQYSTGDQVQINMRAGSLWTTTNYETYMTFLTTPNASTTPTEAMRIFSSGGLSVGTTTDPTSGWINSLNGFKTNNTAGVNCPGGITAGTVVVVGGIITHC